jgi:hypothetical protein
MIDVRARAEFRADFPEDGIEGEGGWIKFPGRGVATAIAEMLERIGCVVSSPIHAHEHGWELIIEFKQESMWCQVSAGEECIMLFTDGDFMGNSGGQPAYLEAIAKLNLEMQRDPRFHNIRWFRWRDPEGPGADAPLNVELGQLPEPAPRRDWHGWLRNKMGSGPT